MIILPEHKLVLITPPKTGSTSLHEFFRNGIFCIGPQGNQLWAANRDHPVYDKHIFCVPYHYREYDVFVVIRNPRDRLLSLYKHYYRWREMVTFGTFLKLQLDWFYDWGIQDYLKSVQMPQQFGYIKIEHINVELAHLGIPNANVPVLHKSNGPEVIDEIPQSWIEKEGISDEYSQSVQ